MKFPFFKVNIILMVNQHDEWRRDRAYLRKKIWRQRRNVFMWRNVTFDHRGTIRHAPFWVWCLREFGKIMIQFQNNERNNTKILLLSQGKIVQQTSLGFLNLLGHGWSVKKTEKAIFDLLKQTYRDCIVTELLFKLCRAERYHGWLVKAH